MRIIYGCLLKRNNMAWYTKGLISEKIYNALLNNFRDLIEKAGDLI